MSPNNNGEKIASILALFNPLLYRADIFLISPLISFSSVLLALINLISLIRSVSEPANSAILSCCSSDTRYNQKMPVC